MQCPKCRYEPTLSEQQASPDVCPKCSVVYAKVRPAAVPASAAKGPAAVAVVDITMPFGSMVWFMVKWALASIPALLILFALGAVALGVVSALNDSWRNAASAPTVSTQRQAIPVPAAGVNAFYVLELARAGDTGVALIETHAADHEVGFSRLGFSCETGLSAMSAMGLTRNTLTQTGEAMALPKQGSPREKIIKWLCSQ